MKRNYQSGAQKKQAKRRKIAEAARNFQQLRSWLTRAKYNLLFRGSNEELSKDNKGNFLSIIFLAKYDTVLDKLLQLPKGSPKYLSSLIQNEQISVLAEEGLHDIKSELQSAPFFALILDTTCFEFKQRTLSVLKQSQIKFLNSWTCKCDRFVTVD